ncbi:hypothetical protein H6G00_28100 [Leptolyngbya sp. FACHB-541]|uniref:hypothetical protein n=1 Tax=Leptolyngbya sp. FACHB-541 TaxID=2692810 RepID=UPI0016851ED9|nr:hypothetical protein [Leptolyngbya sp. FACHB-541]MBD1868609.1 hypothetical protein [Cyanobacteria bacterium FACHB-471]MBD2000419.1 hypothetical protein [Leptolyngbya sp. FACHB-541]
MPSCSYCFFYCLRSTPKPIGSITVSVVQNVWRSPLFQDSPCLASNSPEPLHCQAQPRSRRQKERQWHNLQVGIRQKQHLSTHRYFLLSFRAGIKGDRKFWGCIRL